MGSQVNILCKSMYYKILPMTRAYLRRPLQGCGRHSASRNSGTDPAPHDASPAGTVPAASAEHCTARDCRRRAADGMCIREHPSSRHSDWKYNQVFGSLEHSSLKIVNWNVNRAGPRSKNSRGVEILNRIDQHSPEIVGLTETHPELLQNGYPISPPHDDGYGIPKNLRKVLLWSREPWKHVKNDIDNDQLPPGRFISGVTRTSVGEMTVVGLCIPWCRSRVEVGDKSTWEDHKDYLKHLAKVLARAPSERLVVMGDFNQSIVERRAGSDVAHRADLLQQAIPPHVTLVTCALKTIDHIALSADMEARSVDVISNIHGEKELSDPGRFGIVADVVVRNS